VGMSKARSYLRSRNDVCSIVALPLGVVFRVAGVGLPIQFDERYDARLKFSWTTFIWIR